MEILLGTVEEGMAMDVVRALVARLRLDEGLGAGFMPGAGEGALQAIAALTKEAPAKKAAPAPVQTIRSISPVAAVPAPRRELVEKSVVLAPAPRLEAGYVSLVPYVAPPANPEKEALLADCLRESENCTRCTLCERRSSVVFGEGNLDADVMFIGEGPGKDEDLEGRPFVGRSGRLLTDIIEKGMQRPRSQVYIANVVKCRPPGNRDPRPDEVEACSYYLKQQIEVIRPAVIVAVGMVAGRALLGLPPGTSGLRNGWREHAGIPVRVIYHPSYLLRQRQSEGDRTEADRATWRDVQDVMKKLS